MPRRSRRGRRDALQGRRPRPVHRSHREEPTVTNRIKDYTLSCPCKGLIIEGDLVKTHGDERTMPEPGAVVNCPCGCLHLVREIDHSAHLVIVESLTVDEQIEVYAD